MPKCIPIDIYSSQLARSALLPHKNQYMYTAGITFSMRTTMSLISLQGKEQQLRRLLKNCAMYLLSICYHEYTADEKPSYLPLLLLIVTLNIFFLDH